MKYCGGVGSISGTINEICFSFGEATSFDVDDSIMKSLCFSINVS